MAEFCVADKVPNYNDDNGSVSLQRVDQLDEGGWVVNTDDVNEA